MNHEQISKPQPEQLLTHFFSTAQDGRKVLIELQIRPADDMHRSKAAAYLSSDRVPGKSN